MAKITNLSQFKQYILRKLGSPVTNIEIDSEQLEDSIDDAVQLFYEDHYDGVEVGYIFLDIVAGTQSYTLDENIQAVVEALGNETYSTSTADEPLLCEAFYTPYGITSFSPYLDLVSVEVWRQTIAMYSNAFREYIPFDFNSTSKKFTLLVNPTESKQIALRVYESAITVSEIYNSRWLKRYATELARRQWGHNLTKYEGGTLPGGATFNGQGILDKADERIEALETELYEKYSEPYDFYWG